MTNTPARNLDRKARYRETRHLFDQRRDGKLTKLGTQQAYWFIIGLGAEDVDFLSSTTPFLMQVRGPDFAMGLNDDGTERKSA